jgi:hypothetical protein
MHYIARISRIAEQLSAAGVPLGSVPASQTPKFGAWTLKNGRPCVHGRTQIATGRTGKTSQRPMDAQLLHLWRPVHYSWKLNWMIDAMTPFNGTTNFTKLFSFIVAQFSAFRSSCIATVVAFKFPKFQLLGSRKSDLFVLYCVSKINLIWFDLILQFNCCCKIQIFEHWHKVPNYNNHLNQQAVVGYTELLEDNQSFYF